MGISTFVHVLSDNEIEGLKLLEISDELIKDFIVRLSSRPFLRIQDILSEEDEFYGNPDSCAVDAFDLLIELLGKNKKQKFLIPRIEKLREKNNEMSLDDEDVDFTVLSSSKRKTRSEARKEELENKRQRIESVSQVTPVSTDKYRLDLDKCGALLCYLVISILKLKPKQDEYDMFFALFSSFDSISIGEDVCYGPIYAITYKKIKELENKVKNITIDQIQEKFNHCERFPVVLGGICNVSKENDEKYAIHHFKSFQALLSHAVEQKCGLLFHFW